MCMYVCKAFLYVSRCVSSTHMHVSSSLGSEGTMLAMGFLHV